jgi:hypothetical protein
MPPITEQNQLLTGGGKAGMSVEQKWDEKWL